MRRRRRDLTPTKNSGELGIALISALWISILLGVIAASFVFTARSESEIAHNLVENTKARALADGALYRAIFDLLGKDRRSAVPQIHSRVLTYRFPAGDARVIVEDEGGKIDLNRASRNLLRALFGSVGLNPDHADARTDAVMDWRDRDHLRRLNGAEDNDYRREGLPYGAKDAPFNSIEELQAVMGITPELFDLVSKSLTVYSTTRGVDPMVAPRRVLSALPDLDQDQVSAWIEARQAPGGALPSLAGARRYFSRSRRAVFKIRARAQTHSGGEFVREAIVRLRAGRGKPFVIHVWRQSAVADFIEVEKN